MIEGDSRREGAVRLHWQLRRGLMDERHQPEALMKDGQLLPSNENGQEEGTATRSLKDGLHQPTAQEKKEANQGSNNMGNHSRRNNVTAPVDDPDERR
jgi:hypothetical protein